MDHIIKSRINAYIPAQNNIIRGKLLKELTENSDKSLLLICAPAGYGKTTLVHSYLNQSLNDFAWLQVHSDMDNLFSFLDYLISSIGQINSGFYEETHEIIRSYKEKFREKKAEKTLINEITKIFISQYCKFFKNDIIVVIDNLGAIGNPDWLSTVFNCIFENIPHNLRFIITTRLIPEFNLGVLQAKRSVMKLGTFDLTFSYDEIRELLDSIYNIRCTENELMLLQNKIGGWVTGLHLIMQAYGKDFKSIIPDKNVIGEELFNYFTEDIFSTLDKNVQDFLINTSLLDNFSYDLCDELLELKDSKKIIKELLDRNIFIQNESTSENKNIFSYQLLFKNFLLSKLHETRKPEEIKDFYNRVYAYFYSKGKYDSAITYALLAEEMEIAVPLISQNFMTMYDAGRFEELWKWFEKIEENTLLKNASLLADKSLLLKFFKGDIEKSLYYLDKAIELSDDGKDIDFTIKCIISKTRILIGIGEIKNAIALLKNNIDKDTSAENKAKLLYLLGYSCYQNSSYDESISLLEDAIKITISGKPSDEMKDSKIDIYNLLGNIYLIRGEYSKSISYYEYVSKNARNIIDRYETNCNLILLYAQSGKFETAYEYIQPTREISEKIPLPIVKITFLLALQAFKFEYGEYEESIQLLEEMIRIATGLNHKYYIYLGYSLIADTYYYLGRLSKCEEYYDLAFTYMNEENKLEKIQYASLKAILLKKKDMHPSIEKVLLDAHQFYLSNKFTYNMIQIEFHLADYYLKIGQTKTALKYLTGCLAVSKEKEYFSYLQREYMDTKALFDFALANNVEKNFISMIIDESILKSDANWLTEKGRQKLQKVTENLYDVTISAFGTGEIRIRGRQLPESEWRKKKWKYILIYLFINLKKDLNKDNIIDIFYPEYSPESGDNVFHQIISKFRSLNKISNEPNINTDTSEKAPSAKGRSKNTDLLPLISPLVVYEDKVVKLNRFFRYKLDVTEFGKEIRLGASAQNPQSKIEHFRKAVDLYKGEFLEGVYDSWCEEIRNSLRTEFIIVSETLVELLYNNMEYEKAIFYSENMLKYDKLNEKAYQTTVKSYIKNNKKNLAKEKYLQMLRNYEKEIGEVPDNSFTSQLETLLQ